MILPERKLERIEAYELNLAQRRERWMFRPDKMVDEVTVRYKPEPIVGEWAEWGIFYYLFGWLRKIERPSSETFTFDRIEEPTSDPQMYNYEMQPSCEKLIKRLHRL